MPYTYILKGDRFYVGSTTDLQRRLLEHKRGHTATTKRIGHWNLVFFKEFSSLKDARDFEIFIKKSGHPERFIEEQPR